MSVHECKIGLDQIAATLTSVLAPLGFVYSIAQADDGHQPFASGFFEREDARIGLICRNRGELGTVIYENASTNVSHDAVMAVCGFQREQRLHFDKGRSESTALDGLIGDALAADLSLLEPVLRDPRALATFISDARALLDQNESEILDQAQTRRRKWQERRERRRT